MGLRTRQILSFVFPGQGSQSCGMLNSLAPKMPIIQETFSQASEALQKDLWKLSQEGPEEILNQTVNTQPALLTASVALWRAWQRENYAMPAWLAGHSLGEYSALVCSGSLSLEEGVKLVSLRGKLMQEAVPEGQGAMAAVLGMENSVLQSLCEEAAQGEVVSPVNFNAVGQTVIAGTKSAVLRAADLAKEKGAKKVILLPVSVPSHCALMKNASQLLAKALESTPITMPSIPIIHNVDVEMSQHPDDIRQRLVEQLYCPVRWVETIERFAAEGVTQAVECGPGKVLSGLMKRITPTIQAFPIETAGDWDKAAPVFSS
jgi:[acyl-carrier-protein] S-malonyltransferase